MVRFQDDTGYTRTGLWADGTIETPEREYSPEEVNVLPPVEPSKIICLYGNYLEHLKESGYKVPEEIPKHPKLFLKSPNTVIGHRDVIRLPKPGVDSEEVGSLGEIETGLGRIDYEAELGVVIGKQAKKIPKEDALDFVEGYTCINDVSNRDDQSVERNWVRGKSFDCAAPIGPVIASPELVPEEPRVKLRLNDETKQDSLEDKFIFSVQEVIEEVTKFMTLEPGDVISMGTPKGVGPLSHGDKVEVEIEGIGTLINHARRE